jgi:hypothetical protein
METFKEWLLKREMLSPVPFAAITTAQRDKLGLLTAMPSVEVKVPKWKKKILKKGSEDGDWR